MELLIIFIMPILVAVLVKKLWKRDLYPKLPEGYGKNDICLVCSLRTYFFCGWLLVYPCLSIMTAVGLLFDIFDSNCYDVLNNIMLILGFVVIAIVFVIFMYTIMKNYALVFLKGGILYRTMGGKVYYYKDSEVINYRYVYGKDVVIKTSNGSVLLSRMATSYDEAIQICVRYTYADAEN